MPPNNPPLPKAPEPTKVFFDPYNSSSTGHQRDKNRLSGSTSWRDSRSYKLSHQFRDTSGSGGRTHLADLIGAGSEHFRKDGRKDNRSWEVGAPGLREDGWQDIRGLMAGTRKRSKESTGDSKIDADRKRLRSSTTTPSEFPRLKNTTPTPKRTQTPTDTASTALEVQTAPSSPKATSPPTNSQPNEPWPPSSPPPPQIFRNLNIYLNGSTAPLISDHKLKQLFAQHGGNASISLGRRTVTHVIIGDNCGGGLASTKIEKEVTTVGGKGIKFVTAQWVLDSVEKGIRQPEARYSPDNLKRRIGGSGQGSVRDIFMKQS